MCEYEIFENTFKCCFLQQVVVETKLNGTAERLERNERCKVVI